MRKSAGGQGSCTDFFQWALWKRTGRIWRLEPTFLQPNPTGLMAGLILCVAALIAKRGKAKNLLTLDAEK